MTTSPSSRTRLIYQTDVEENNLLSLDDYEINIDNKKKHSTFINKRKNINKSMLDMKMKTNIIQQIKVEKVIFYYRWYMD